MGIYLGDEGQLIGGDTYNEKGYYENKELSYLAEDVLLALGGNHIRPPFLYPAWEKNAVLDPFRAKAAALVREKFRSSSAWGWKDPRNSILLPFWRQIVQPTHFVIALRNPLEVAASLLVRNGLPIRNGSELWLLHAASALFNTMNEKRLVVFFEDTRSTPDLVDKRLCEFLGVQDQLDAATAAAEFSSSLVHYRQDADDVYSHPEIHPLAKALYRDLRALTYGETEGQKSSGHVVGLVEAEPSSIINPLALPNCFSPDSGGRNLSERLIQMPTFDRMLSERDEKIGSLNLTLAKSDEQIDGLTEVLTARDSQVADLERMVAEQALQVAGLGLKLNARDDQVADLERTGEKLSRTLNNQRVIADDLYSQLSTVLNSRSWRLTKPLRGISRYMGARELSADDRASLIEGARSLGRRLPIPLRVKASLRSLVLRQLGGARRHPIIDNRASRSLPDTHTSAMRAECCGLIPDLVSVVLPVYNQASMLADSIESVLGQTYQNFELIVLNDGSTDGVEQVLSKYEGHPKVRLYTQRNQKLPKALSNAFDLAQGEFWTWTSADNLMEPRQLELLVQRLKSSPALGMVYADYYAIDDRGELLQDTAWRAHNRPDVSSAEIRLPRSAEYLNVVQDNFIGACFMYRGWVGRLIGEYDPIQGIEDYDYWMRINDLFSIEHLGSDDLLYRYRVHDNTLNARAGEEKILDKVQDLMQYEKKRAAFFKKPQVFYADDTAAAWLGRSGSSDVEVRPISQLRNDSLEDVSLAISAENLADLSRLESVEGLPLILLFDGGDDTPYDCVAALRRPGTMAVVTSPEGAWRARAVGSAPVIDGLADSAVQAVRAFAKNRLFYNSTRDLSSLSRVEPVMFSSQSFKKCILLQAEGFTQGGMENVMIDLASTLELKGFEVRILVLGKAGDAVDKARQAGLHVDVFGDGLNQMEYSDYLISNKVSVVNAHYSVFGAGIAHNLGVPFVQTIHNSYVWLDPAAIEQFRLADAFTEKYTCVSMTAAKYADCVLGLDVKKMVVLPNGVDTTVCADTDAGKDRARLRATWGVGENDKVFLNVASMLATKAQLPLVQAFARFVAACPTARLVLLGAIMDEEYSAKVRDFVRSSGLERNVIFAGYDRNVASYYSAADVFVLPSFWEGWSLSFGEALYVGLPIVSTNVGAAQEFENVGNVVIIDPPFGDVTNLNCFNLSDFVYGDDQGFVLRLADGLSAAAKLGRMTVADEFRERLSRSAAYGRYAELFGALH